ncbi:MAG: 30S ribosome-binding factor RbfA [Acidobacteria bacterium]|nr:30S ribosome-binding factor RbfA [Acidobacteriota bacterium]
MGYRNTRLPQALREEISAILQRELRDQVTAMTSITEVKVSAELSEARIFVSVFGSPTQQRATMSLLAEQAVFIRRLLGQRMRLRSIPPLHFVLDETLEHGARMGQILDEIAKELPPEDVVPPSDTTPET